MPRLRGESENRAAGAGEATRRRARIRAVARRQRAGRPDLQRTGRWNEQGFPRAVSRPSDAVERAAVCISPAGAATDPLGRQRWFGDEQVVWHRVLIDMVAANSTLTPTFSPTFSRQFNGLARSGGRSFIFKLLAMLGDRQLYSQRTE